MDWRSQLRADPLPYLLRTDDGALLFQIRRDLQGKRGIKVSELWGCKEIKGLEKKQREDGTWKYPGKHSGLALGEDYDFFQAWKVLSMLVECYCMDRSHPMVERAVEALLVKQTVEGDIRGIYGNQYSPNYTAAAIENWPLRRVIPETRGWRRPSPGSYDCASTTEDGRCPCGPIHSFPSVRPWSRTPCPP